MRGNIEKRIVFSWYIFSMKKFLIKSLGCKQNTLEAQIMEDELLNLGYKSTSDIIEADFYIMNSCCVTSHASSQVNYLINQAKKQNPNLKIILTGCCAQTNNDFSGNIDLVLGNKEKINIGEFLEKSGIFKEDVFKNKTFQNKFLYKPKSTRPSIKIQDGCNNRCSYCIIPYARGNSRSNSVENITKQINILTEQNIKEVVLTGIHIGQWGLEFNKNLTYLLREIEKTDICRFRLGSLYVNEIDDEMIEFLKKSKKFCHHFHLSLQSLSDKILKLMNRSYSSKEAMDKIEKLRSYFPSAFFGCDIIVGFPDETDEDFMQTYKNLEKSCLSYIHVFPYSMRENTPASKMKQVQDSIKTKRAKKLTELSTALHKKFLEENKNKKAEILVQKKNPKTNKYSAITGNYIKIEFEDKNDNLRHTIKTVDLSEYELL